MKECRPLVASLDLRRTPFSQRISFPAQLTKVELAKQLAIKHYFKMQLRHFGSLFDPSNFLAIVSLEAAGLKHYP